MQRFTLSASLAILAVLMACSVPSAWASADLQAVAFSSMSPNPIAAGTHPHNITFTYANNGPEALDVVTYELYLSRNTTFGDSDDLKIGEYDEQFWPGCLYPGLFEDVLLSTTDSSGMSWFTIPSAASGTYYVILRVIPAAYSSQTDTNPANNVVCSTTAISVGVPPCAYSIAQTSGNAPGSGGAIGVALTAGSSCGWAADNLGAGWVSFSPSSGAGNATISVMAAPNDTCLARSCNVTIAGQTFTVNQQAGSGTFSLSASTWSASSAAQGTNVMVTAGAGCNWSVLNPAPGWITVTPSSGVGNRVISVTVTTNSTGAPRACTLTIAGQSFAITQDAFSCNYYIQPTSSSIYADATTNRIWLTTDAGCSWSVINTNDWISVNPTNGVGSATIQVSATANTNKDPRTGYISIGGQDFLFVQAGTLPGWIYLTLPEEQQLVSRYAPQFRWQASGTPATWYHLRIVNSTVGKTWVDTWTQTCHWQATSNFAVGSYTWSVQGWNSAGLGPLSGPGYFTVQAGVPSAPTLTSPQGQTNAMTLAYSWTSASLATWHELCIVKDGVIFADNWYGNGTNRVTVTGHRSGNYQWWVRGWNPDGMGPWSSMASFSVSLGLPQAVLPDWPLDASTNLDLGGMRFSWSRVSNAEWYCLRLNRNGTNYLMHWVQTNDFIFTNSVPAGNYTWKVQAWNSDGLGPWSTERTMTLLADGSPLLPVGTVPYNSTACYRWCARSNPATPWYELYINKDGALFYHKWVDAVAFDYHNDWSGEVCITGHAAGAYTWWVRPWTEQGGLGAWSDAASFTMQP